MADEENTEIVEAQEPEGDNKPDPSATPDDGDADEAFDKERALATIRKLREAEKEGKRTLKQLTDAQTRLKELEDAKLSEEEKRERRLEELEAERATWEQERQDTRLRLAVYARSAELNVADADLALAVLDRSKVEYGKDGEPLNVADVLLELLEARPILKAAKGQAKGSSLNAGEGARPGPAPQLNAAQLEAARSAGMEPEEYATWQGITSIDDYERLRKAQAGTQT